MEIQNIAELPNTSMNYICYYCEEEVTHKNGRWRHLKSDLETCGVSATPSNLMITPAGIDITNMPRREDVGIENIESLVDPDALSNEWNCSRCNAVLHTDTDNLFYDACDTRRCPDGKVHRVGPTNSEEESNA